MDDEILLDALRTMCLSNTQVSGSYRVETVVPDQPVFIDLEQCTVSRESMPGSVDIAPPAYLFPPSFAAELRDRGLPGYRLQILDTGSLVEAAEAIKSGVNSAVTAGFALTANRT
jgi:hypothetical protein